LKERFKDSKIVEFDIIESIITKISNWGKLLAYFIAVPLGLLAILLGAIGIKTYSDFMGLVNTAKEQAIKNIDKAKHDIDSLSREYENLKTQLAGVNNLADEVRGLTTTVASNTARIRMLVLLDALPEADAIALVTRPPTPINDDMRQVAERIDP